MKVARQLISGIAFVVVAAACGDDAVKPEDVLTEEEAVALFKSMKTVQSDATLGILFHSEDSTVVRCPRGGQARLVFEVVTDSTAAPDTVLWGLNLDVAPRGCKLVGNGMEFAVDGDPSVRDESRILFVNAFPVDQTGSFKGGVKWELEDRSGSCAFDMTLAEIKAHASDPDKLIEVHTGTICGNRSEVEIERALNVTT